ncbi:hypothetical protein P8452_02546 [Trifolium repens]|nr:hypothetical protein P8452_02546 [Trifolium repens]
MIKGIHYTHFYFLDSKNFFPLNTLTFSSHSSRECALILRSHLKDYQTLHWRLEPSNDKVKVGDIVIKNYVISGLFRSVGRT